MKIVYELHQITPDKWALRATVDRLDRFGVPCYSERIFPTDIFKPHIEHIVKDVTERLRRHLESYETEVSGERA